MPAAKKEIPMMFTPGIAHAWEYPQPKWVRLGISLHLLALIEWAGFNAWEPILVYGKPAGRVPLDHYTLVPRNFSRGIEREHPCPKPIELWMWLLSMLCGEGQTVLDPFLGSGTTLRAAARISDIALLRIEAEERYCEIAANRLSQQVLAL